MIKVIHVITDSNIGGVGTCLLNILDCFDRDRFEMEVILPTGSLLLPEIEKRGIVCIELKHIGEASFNWRAVGLLHGLFVKKKPDVVHTHAALSARIAAKWYGQCRIIHTRHSVFEQPEKLKRFPRKQIAGCINNFFSDDIIAVSPAAMDNLTETGTNPDKITVIYNGVKQQEIVSPEACAAAKKRYGLWENNYIVAILARIEEVKGHDYLLDAAKIIGLEDSDIRIAIVGTGSLEEHLKKRAEDELIENVIFTGFIKEINEIENMMDLQVNASYGTEATSNSLLEGMSLGKPAVVTDFGGNPYVIEDGVNGLVVEAKNAHALAEAILQMKRDEKLYGLCSENSLRVFEEKFTVQAMMSQLSDMYEKSKAIERR